MLGNGCRRSGGLGRVAGSRLRRMHLGRNGKSEANGRSEATN